MSTLEVTGLEESLEETHLMGIVHSFGGLVFTPSRHELLEESAFLQAVKRRAREMGCRVHDRLFLYRHRIRGSFVLAYWIPGVEPVKAMVEVDLWHEHPDHAKIPPSMESVEHNLLPRAKKVQEIAQQAKDEQYRLIMERRRQGYLVKEHAAKALAAGHESEAAVASVGASAYHFPEDKGELEAIADRLLRRRRG